MNFTVLFALIAAALTGGTCAAHDSRLQAAAWATTGQLPHATTYTVSGGRLRYASAPGPTDNLAWRALHASENRMLEGLPALACAPV